MSHDLDQPDEIEIQGKRMKRLPSEGWTFIFITNPETPPMRLTDQPRPNKFCHFHRAEEPDADPIVFTLFGREDEEKMAYYVKGAWQFNKPDTDIFAD